MPRGLAIFGGPNWCEEFQPMTPTARTLDLMRRSGYLADVCERWVPVPGKNIRRDLFHAFDVLAVHPVRREVVLIQTTTADHLAHRLAKVKAVPELAGLLAAGCKIQLHGWKQLGHRWSVRILEVQAEDLAAVVVTAPARRRKRPHQPGLFDGVA
jgi:hypothetical protein